MVIRNPSLVCLAALLFSNFAYASDMDDFTRLDVDQDARLTSTEFAELAADRGGSRNRGRPAPSGDRFAEADFDGDGYLSLSEFSALRGRRIHRDRA